MGVVKNRGATRKLGPISSGRVIHLKPKNLHRKFAVHEDLICKSSAILRKRLQKHRKDIAGECPICSEELNRFVADITFCRSGCGQNIHSHCLEEWKQRRKERTTCPMCRNTWTEEPADVIELDASDLDPKALQTYIDWLYTEKLLHDSDIGENSDGWNVSMLKALPVGAAVKDDNFKHDMIAIIVDATESKRNPGFWIDSVKYAFETTNDPWVRGFVRGYSGSTMKPDWFVKDASNFPEAFLLALGSSMSQRHSRYSARQSFLHVFTNGNYVLQSEDDR